MRSISLELVLLIIHNSVCNAIIKMKAKNAQSEQKAVILIISVCWESYVVFLTIE